MKFARSLKHKLLGRDLSGDAAHRQSLPFYYCHPIPPVECAFNVAKLLTSVPRDYVAFRGDNKR